MSKGFVTGTGELVSGLAGTWGIAKSGGLTRIADGIKSLVEFGKRQVGRVGVLPTGSFKRPPTNVPYPKDMSPWKTPTDKWRYPPDDGFAAAPKSGLLPKGTLIDRFGEPIGNFLSPVDTPFDMRALPPDSASKSYYVYRVLKPLPVESGEIAGWFGQPGGGIQYKLPKPLQWFLDNKYIEVVAGPL